MHNYPNCEITLGEKRAAKALNMHPEDVHRVMDAMEKAWADMAKERLEAEGKKRYVNEWLNK